MENSIAIQSSHNNDCMGLAWRINQEYPATSAQQRYKMAGYTRPDIKTELQKKPKSSAFFGIKRWEKISLLQ